MKSPSGVYNLSLGRDSSQPPVPAYCDMETDGGNWTVFQRRDATLDERQSFEQGWDAYRNGFGNLTGEFWWGLQNVRILSKARDRPYELRVDLTDPNGTVHYAIYRRFRLSPEKKGYKLKYNRYQLTGYNPESARADDGFGDYFHRHVKFATHDNDHSGRGCASNGGWWLAGETPISPTVCSRRSYLNGPVETGNPLIGSLFWPSSPGTLQWKKSAMMIRPMWIMNRTQCLLDVRVSPKCHGWTLSQPDLTWPSWVHFRVHFTIVGITEKRHGVTLHPKPSVAQPYIHNLLHICMYLVWFVRPMSTLPWPDLTWPDLTWPDLPEPPALVWTWQLRVAASVPIELKQYHLRS